MQWIYYVEVFIQKLIYKQHEGLATKQGVFILIANVTLRHKRTFLYYLSSSILLYQDIYAKQSLSETGSNTKIQRFYLPWMT